MFQTFHTAVRDNWIHQMGVRDGPVWGAPTGFPSVTSATTQAWDYQFRPVVMEMCAVYFFLAGTRLTRTTASATWDWYTAQDADEDLIRTVRCSNGETEERRDHPCYRNCMDPRLFFRCEICKDDAGQPVPLRRPDGTPIARADH